MRSAVVVGLVLLAACNRTAPAPTVQATREAATVAPSKATDATANESRTVVPPKINALPGHAFGTEPFWSFKIGPDTLRYSTPEVMDIKVDAKLKDDGNSWRFTATLQGKPMVLTIEPGECNDGMSDNVYPFKAEFTWDGKTEHGCAKLN